jgi:hypothetical protein
VVEAGGAEPFEQPVGTFGVDPAATSAGDVPERVCEVGLADPDSGSDRLQHLRAVLPCEVRVIGSTHPLFGQLLEAVAFKRVSGVLHLVVGLPDGTPGTILAASTSVFGEGVSCEVAGTVLTVEGVRRLRTLTEAVRGSQRRSAQTRK